MWLVLLLLTACDCACDRLVSCAMDVAMLTGKTSALPSYQRHDVCYLFALRCMCVTASYFTWNHLLDFVSIADQHSYDFLFLTSCIPSAGPDQLRDT